MRTAPATASGPLLPRRALASRNRPGLTPGGVPRAPSVLSVFSVLSAFSVLGVLLLSGCGGGEEPAETSATAPMLLTEKATPEGYSWNSVAEVIQDAGDSLGNQLDAAAAAVATDPASCMALVPTSDSIIAELYDHRDTIGAVEFLPKDSTDPAVVDAVVSTADDGNTAALATGSINAADCADFTRTRSDGSVTHFKASAQKASAVTSEDITVITVLSDSVTPGEELITTITGTVEGVHFRIAAAGVTDLDLLTELAQQQVAQITEYMEGQD